jgi:outer membrane protein TolC
MKVFIILTMMAGSMQASPPDTLSLEYCYSRVEDHYPIANKIELQKQITNLNKKITNTASYPQLNFGASATYRSEVTEFQVSSGAGRSVGPDLSKDQYEAALDITQTIYNRGAIGIKKGLEQVRGEQQQESIKVQLQKIREQVNSVYFGILLAKKQLDIISTVSENLKAQIKSVRSKVENGAVLPTQQYILEAERIKITQDSTEIDANIRSAYTVLGQLIGEELTSDIPLMIPERNTITQNREASIQFRPEFDVFESNRQALEYQKELAQTKKIPSLSAFGTAAYGRPGFNFFENDLHGYYLVGLKLQWNFWGALNAGTRQEVYNLSQKSIKEEEKAFERQLKADLSKIKEEIASLESRIRKDDEIITLREKVVEVVSSQLENGTATATEYITELNKATQARLSMMMHRIKLAQAKVEYETALGIRAYN